MHSLFVSRINPLVPNSRVLLHFINNSRPESHYIFVSFIWPLLSTSTCFLSFVDPFHSGFKCIAFPNLKQIPSFSFPIRFRDITISPFFSFPSFLFFFFSSSLCIPFPILSLFFFSYFSYFPLYHLRTYSRLSHILHSTSITSHPIQKTIRFPIHLNSPSLYIPFIIEEPISSIFRSLLLAYLVPFRNHQILPLTQYGHLFPLPSPSPLHDSLYPSSCPPPTPPIPLLSLQGHYMLGHTPCLALKTETDEHIQR